LTKFLIDICHKACLVEVKKVALSSGFLCVASEGAFSLQSLLLPAAKGNLFSILCGVKVVGLDAYTVCLKHFAQKTHHQHQACHSSWAYSLPLYKISSIA